MKKIIFILMLVVTSSAISGPGCRDCDKKIFCLSERLDKDGNSHVYKIFETDDDSDGPSSFYEVVRGRLNDTLVFNEEFSIKALGRHLYNNMVIRFTGSEENLYQEYSLEMTFYKRNWTLVDLRDPFDGDEYTYQCFESWRDLLSFKESSL